MVEGWNIIPLREIAEFQNGFAFSSRDYVKKSPKNKEVLRMGYIKRGGGFKEFDKAVFIPQNHKANEEKFALEHGDIVIAMTDMKDKVAILGNCARITDTGRFLLNQRVGRIRTKDKNKANQRFLYYFLNSPSHILNLRSRANTGVQVNLTTESIIESNISLPSISEQIAISSILGVLDEKIELNQKTNETIEKIAKSLFKSWFIDFDPVKEKVKDRSTGLPKEISDLFPDLLVDSELGKIPRGWEIKKLGEIIELVYGKPLKESDRIKGSYPVFGSNGIVGFHNNYLVKGPGIIVGRKGNPGIVKWSYDDFFPIDTTFYVKPKSSIREMTFIFFALHNQKLSNLSADSAVPGLNRNIAYMSQQIIPSASLLEIFEQQIKDLFLGMKARNLQSLSLQKVKDTLLPKLISGKIRITDAEKMIDEVGI